METWYLLHLEVFYEATDLPQTPELMESQHYESIKVTDLVKYIGIGHSTFYSRFDSICSVLQCMEDDFIAGLPFPEYNLKETLLNDRKVKTDYLNHVKKYKKDYLILNGPDGDPSFKVRLANHTRRVPLSPVSTPHRLDPLRPGAPCCL